MPEQFITMALAICQCIILGLLCFIAKFVMSTSTAITKLVTWSAGHEELDHARFQSVREQLEKVTK